MKVLMDADTLAALKGSIAKWQAIVDGTGKDEGAVNCPLCRKFNKYYINSTIEGDCDDCPVAMATGQNGCHGSPYDVLEDMDGDESAEEFRAAAQAELDFLISLLPEGESP